ncbi:MAG: hypothetical protein VXZ51_04590 [Actinomycetota bacterium]|nr:hypothetical protein [Actinomycetota bacterium]|tara:strand:+ start:5277 stop:6743 length:1467 start_codon:yes stop_codon:yes gene_type:complete
MGIIRYIATADAEITNAYTSNLRTRATGSNMGAADTMGIFSIYGQSMSSSVEQARALLQFDMNTVINDRANASIPASGSVNFFLRMFNSAHPFTLPSGFNLIVRSVANRSWTEGDGKDAEEYSDKGAVNWASASQGTAWTTAGGDYHAESPSTRFTQYFDTGAEDLEIDITDFVESWINESKANYGVGVMLESSKEDGSAQRSYYIKKFHSRNSSYFNRRPVIEARWDSSIRDDRGDFYYSSSLAPADENVSRLAFYNVYRGQLTNVGGVDSSHDTVVYCALYKGDLNGPADLPLQSPVTASNISRGIYQASFTLQSQSLNPNEYIYDVWYGKPASPELGQTGTEFHTGSYFLPIDAAALNYNPVSKYVTSCTSLKSEYSRTETARLRFFTRKENWSPTIYSKASQAISGETIRDAFWKLHRVVDGLTIVNYGTGSSKQTKLSYDKDGSYFDLDMSLLEGGYSYGITLLYSGSYGYTEQPEVFKFRVE